jgi:uncharacterized protein YfkK (UPF0435 family)
MKMSDILRSMADKIDAIQGTGQDQSQGQLEPVAVDSPEQSKQDVMIAPLQQKLEILKKATGMDNAFDSQSNDELGDIKKLTGIKAVIQHEAGEDNDIVG